MNKYGIKIKHLPTGTEITSDIAEYSDKEYEAMIGLLEAVAGDKTNYFQIVKNGDKVYIPKLILQQSIITLFKETVWR